MYHSLVEKNRYNNQIFKLFVGIVFLFISFSWITAQTIVVKGKVSTTEGTPLPFVVIGVKDSSNKILTSLTGEYQLTTFNQDSLLISFALIGYGTQRRLLVNPSDTTILNITLHSQEVQLNEAQVLGNRIQTNQTQTININDIKKAPSTTGNEVEETIAKQAGVSTHNELSSQYNVRGGSFDENSVYINGVEIFRPFLINTAQQEGLSMINSKMVEKIAFSTGGFEAKYGERMSSVLDITYKKIKGFEASLSGSFLGSDAYLGWGNNKLSILNSLRYKTTAYLLSSLDTKGEYKPSFFDYQTYLSWKISPKWQLDWLGNISNNSYLFIPKDRETKFGTLNNAKKFKVYFGGKEEDKFNTLFTAFSLIYKFSNQQQLNFTSSFFHSKEEVTYDILGQYWVNETQSTETLGVGSYLEYARNYLKARLWHNSLNYFYHTAKHKLQLGFKWKYENIEEKQKEWEMRDSVGYSLPHQQNSLDLIYSLRSNNRLSGHRLETFIQDSYHQESKLGNFIFNYGLRLTYWNWNKETLLSPRFSVAYLPKQNPNLVFRFATGLYYQAPFFKELKDTIQHHTFTETRMSKNIVSPRSLQFVLGGDYIFKLNERPFKLTIEAYYKYLTRLIPYNVDNMRIVYYGNHITEGYTTGLDFKLYGEFIPNTNSWITLSLMKARQRMNLLWLPLPTDQRYNFSAYFTDYFPGSDRWALVLKAAFADGLPFGAPHSGIEKQHYRSSPYKRVDIGLNYLVYSKEKSIYHKPLLKNIKNIWIGVDAFNVFGLNNVSAYYWVTDISNQQYAVPNYLTGRQLNVKLMLDF